MSIFPGGAFFLHAPVGGLRLAPRGLQTAGSMLRNFGKLLRNSGPWIRNLDLGQAIWGFAQTVESFGSAIWGLD